MHKFWNELGHLRRGMWQTCHTPGQVLIKPQDGWNRPTGWNVKGPAIRAWGQYHSRVLDRRASAGCCEGATAEKAVPFPSDCPSIPNSSCVRSIKGQVESVRCGRKSCCSLK